MAVYTDGVGKAMTRSRRRVGKSESEVVRLPRSYESPCHLTPCHPATAMSPPRVYSRDAAAGVRRETPRWDPHLVSALVGEFVTDWVQLLIATATALLGALGLAYWAYRAQTDRSALVGLYLLFGIPAVLLLLAGRGRPAPGRPRSRPAAAAGRDRVRPAPAAAIPRGAGAGHARSIPIPRST